MGVRCLRTQESVGVLRRLQVEAWGPSCSRLATSQEGAAHAKGEGGRGGRWWLQSFFKLGRSSLQSAEKFVGGCLGGHQRLLRLQCAGGGPLAGSPQEWQLDGCLGLWKSSPE